MLADDPRTRTTVPPVDDPLERMDPDTRAECRTAREDYPFEMVRHDSGPTPFEAFAWYSRAHCREDLPRASLRSIVMVAGAERLPASSTAYTSIVFTMPSVRYMVNWCG